MPFIFREEGGLSMIRSDRGNWTGGKVGVGELRGTKYGIASHSHPNLDIQNLSREQATVIYANEYWGPSGCPDLPAGVDLQIMDHSVNAGVSRGKAYARSTDNLPAQQRIKTIAARRTAWYRGLKEASRFGKVWLGRVARAEAAGLKMALKASGASSVEVSQTLRKESVAAEAQVKKGQAGATVAGSGAATGSGVVVTAGTADVSWGLVVVGILICAGLSLIAIHFIRAKYERIHALEQEANIL